ncbi:serine/threonine-protein kinase [Kitasatospora gansuensis]|uniref:Serine/threonine-protein kinase n=1 Tax=Kitasatospora gansuensis TaxID=258050 RepID=A0A7W7SJV0_9ACTN|nr:serine/threonine-protein kinase [Kitasatospora gansuensis]MBB4951755.1 serine/threonine-protein kinase [Kitasatospora gansuensis]
MNDCPVPAAGRPLPDGAVAVPPGYRVGDWEVTGFLGAGGWGSVHLARRVGPVPDGEPAEAAVKFLSTTGLAPRQARALAETADREVAFSRATDHPHLIRVLGTEIVSDPDTPSLDGAIALIMELAERSLLDALGRSDQPGRDGVPDDVLSQDGEDPEPGLPEAGPLLIQIAEALAHLHASGWVHGDLKPANILLMADGTARLADFGLAARIEGTHGYAPPLGSPDYLPPERRTEQLSERGVMTRPGTDIWAFGITAHQLLTGGALPFGGGTPAARAAAVHEYGTGRGRLRLAAELPPAWHAVLIDCLAADPAERARHTMDTLLPRIRAAAAETAPAPRRVLRRGPWTVLGAVLLAGAVTAAWIAWPSGDAGTGPTVAATKPIRVYNMDGNCKDLTERVPACSLGLARDPHRKYAAGNVVSHRVWHDDVLLTDCVINDGDRVEDENGIGTPRWYRVWLDSIPEHYAWLPAVRTRDDPQAPVCPASATSPAPVSPTPAAAG